MANQAPLERLISVLTSIVQEVYKTVEAPTTALDYNILLLEELRQARIENAEFHQRVICEMEELRQAMCGGRSKVMDNTTIAAAADVRDAAEHNVQARTFNGSHYHDGGKLQPLVNEHNQDIMGFPQHYKDVNMMSESELIHLLRAFGLSTGGSVWERQSRFKYFIGVFQVARPKQLGALSESVSVVEGAVALQNGDVRK